MATASNIFLPFKKACWFLVNDSAKVALIHPAITFVIILKEMLHREIGLKSLKETGS